MDLDLWRFELKIKWPQTQRTLGCWWQCWAEIWRPTRLASQACNGNIWIKKHDFFCNFWGPMKQVNPLKTPFYIPCLLKRLAPCGRINQFDGIYCSIGDPPAPVNFNSSLLLMLKMLLTYLAGMMKMVHIISTGHDCHRSGMMLVRALSRSNEMTTTQ